MYSESPPVVWILHSDRSRLEARVRVARQLSLAAVPVESATQALSWLGAGGGLIPDLILYDEAIRDMKPVQFAEALTRVLGDLAPPVVYIVNGRKGVDAPGSLLVKKEQDVVIEEPVSAREVIATIFSVLDRSAEASSVLRAGGLELDVIPRTLVYRGRNVRLTRLEGELMAYLMRRAGRPVAHDELLKHVWGFEPGTGGREVVRAHVRNVRRKLKLLGAPPDLIWALPGRGYRLGREIGGHSH